MRRQRRRLSAQFKLETVLEGLRGEKPIDQMCRERNITDSLYYKWRDQFTQQAATAFGEAGPDRRYLEQEARIAELERMVGRLALKNEALKKRRVGELVP